MLVSIFGSPCSVLYYTLYLWFSGVTRGGQVAHPWKVWGEILEGREKEEKGKGEGKRGGK